VTTLTDMSARKSGAIRSSGASRPTTVLVMSADPTLREGWARSFETVGFRAIRCAGPQSTSCALETRDRCPLHDDADVAFYDHDSVSPELTVRLMTLPRAIPVMLARDRETPDGGHEAVPVQLLDAHTAGVRTAKS